MNPDLQNLIDLINATVRNYPVEAFQNMGLNRILLIMCQIIGGIIGGGGLTYSPTRVNQTNFINATDCPLAAFNVVNFDLFWNDASKFLTLGVDYHVLVGGGFGMDIPGFDATAQHCDFVLFPTI